NAMLHLAKDRRCVIAKLLDSLPQPSQNAAARDVYGPNGQAQFGSHFLGYPSPYRCQPECLPGGRSEFAPNLIGRPPEYTASILGIKQGRGRWVGGRLRFQ